MKSVIAFKQAEALASIERLRKSQKRDALRQAIADAEAREMGSKSVDELKDMLKELGEN